jgi:hypothetical protein
MVIDTVGSAPFLSRFIAFSCCDTLWDRHGHCRPSHARPVSPTFKQYGGFHSHGGTPIAEWFIVEKPNLIAGCTFTKKKRDSGNLHIPIYIYLFIYNNLICVYMRY